jgi:hypothetical protein
MSIQIEYATVAHCGAQHIWTVFREIERWPRWDPQAIRSVRWVSGDPWTKGARFEIALLKPFTYTLTPEIHEIDPPVYLHWRGKGGGVTGEQFFIFRAIGNNATEMRTLQEYTGAVVSLGGKRLEKPILAGVEHMFRMLKAEAEAIAASESAPPADVL